MGRLKINIEITQPFYTYYTFKGGFMKFIVCIIMLLFCFQIFCSNPNDRIPPQEIMSSYPIPEYYLPEHTLPAAENAVYYRIDQAILELHQEGFEPENEALSKSAAKIAQIITKKRLLGVCGIMCGALGLLVAVPSPLRYSNPEIPIASAILCASGAVIFGDSIADCCCWKQKLAKTKQLIKDNHTKIQ